MARSEEQNHECPLCLEPLEIDDLNFFPCTCGYQICRFCWHRIRTDENGLCPACRKQYPEDPADFKPVSVEEVQRIKNEKRQKDLQKRQKMSDKRKSLSQVRVVQNNLVFVVGLPPRLADADVLKRHEYFGKYGKLHKIVVNNCTSYAGSQGPSASAYVTYEKAEDALHALQAVNNIQVDGRSLKASLGTTKYCSHFLRNQQCPKPDCMYLHEFGAIAGSFTKEEMQQGKHQEYERKLIEQILDVSLVNRKNVHSLNSSDEEETWPLPSENQNISITGKVHEDQPIQIPFDDSSNPNSIESDVCEESVREQTKGTSSLKCSQGCESVEYKSVSTLSRNYSLSLDALQCKLDNVCVSSSSSSRESLYSANSDGQMINSNNVNSCENVKSDSDYETDKTDQEVQRELCRIERPRGDAFSQSPEFFSSNSSLSTPDSTMSDGPLPFSPSSSPVVSSHLQYFPRNNCLQTEPKSYLATNVGTPPGFRYSTFEMKSDSVNPPSVKKIPNVSLNNHTGPDWDSSDFPNTCQLQNVISDRQSSLDTTHDDDLGFDPFDESNKGLADLLQEEAKGKATDIVKEKSHTRSSGGRNDSVFSNSFNLPPAFQSSKMPPPGFSASVPANYSELRPPYANGLTLDNILPTMNQPPQRIPLNVTREMYQEYVMKPAVMNNYTSNSPSTVPYNSKLNRIPTKEFQDNLKTLLPNMNVKFGSVVNQSARLPPGLAPNQKMNNQREEYSWVHDPAIISSGNVTNGSTWATNPQWVPSQIIAEENARKYNSYINSCYGSFPPRVQPSTAVQPPPPGFNLSLRPLQMFSENSKINDSNWYSGRM